MKPLVVSCWLLAVSAAVCGCSSSYSWRPSVPEEVRTVSVPTFRNESNVSEFGAIATRQILREFQREGTFKIRMTGDSAVEIQGVIKSVSPSLAAYNRRQGGRIAGYDVSATAEISVIDKRNRKVLVDNRKYVANATFTAGQDRTTAIRDASGRLADDFARQVVDDLLNLKW
ncbi:MAG: hypothetical protein KBT68_11005 [bacterium]|nr:hypothetical protein [Candidatus Colisoma equi]